MLNNLTYLDKFLRGLIFANQQVIKTHQTGFATYILRGLIGQSKNSEILSIPRFIRVGYFLTSSSKMLRSLHLLTIVSSLEMKYIFKTSRHLPAQS